ncbi:MAG: hypothetical protein LUM44_13800 [Pyrinomonadaceae bacterium]|nr:hypothetical protein [Pyrinomonadaceae bacterium]
MRCGQEEVCQQICAAILINLIIDRHSAAYSVRIKRFRKAGAAVSAPET